MAALPMPGRRSSATRELYLTKYYFYQQQDTCSNSKTGEEDVERYETSCVKRSELETPDNGAKVLGKQQQQQCDRDRVCSQHKHLRLAAELELSCKLDRLRQYRRQVSQVGANSDNSSLVSTSSVSPYSSNSTSQQRSSDQQVFSAASRCLSSSSNQRDQSQATSQANQTNQTNQVSQTNQTSNQASPEVGQCSLRAKLERRRNSSPNLEQPARSVSIEEQLRRLLEIAPANEQIQRKEEAHSALRWHQQVASMKKSGGGGANWEQSRQQQQRQQSAISPDDRLMIFMLASRSTSTSTNSNVERNARILKWLNNCKSAG